MNKVFLTGNLTRDPELTTTPNGYAVCKFSVAVNRGYNSSGDKEADFFNISVWRGLGENCAKYLSKGKKVAISGNLQLRTYDDKDGNKRFSLDVTADEVEFLSPRGEGDSQPPAPKQGADLKPVESDDLPF